MSRRRATRLAALLAALTALLLPAAPALAFNGGPAAVASPSPRSPDDAAALAAATADESSGSAISMVDAVTALAASALPGAETSIEAGFSPDAAVGLAPYAEIVAPLAGRPACWANAAWHQWGTWPYQQRLTDTTYWCAIYGSHITYRSSTTTASGTLCGVAWRATQLIAGGVGSRFSYFTTRASAGYSCETVIPWITLHTTHHEDVKRNDLGKTTFMGTG